MTQNNKWQPVYRMTPKQRGAIMDRVKEFQNILVKGPAEYVLLRADNRLSAYYVRRCPYCAYIAIIFAARRTVQCDDCGKFAEV